MDYAPFTSCKMQSNIYMKRTMKRITKRIEQRRVKRRKKEKKRKKKKEEENEENEETSILTYFSACMFEYEDIAEFEQKFNLMRQKVSKQTWLDSIYKLKEKWAECYMKDVFILGMRSAQLSESLNNDLKIHFKSDFDMIRFFKHFERVMQGKRNNELNSEFDSRKKCLKYV
jgi:zinc finger SWIM domain-containing protein 3